MNSTSLNSTYKNLTNKSDNTNKKISIKTKPICGKLYKNKSSNTTNSQSICVTKK